MRPKEAEAVPRVALQNQGQRLSTSNRDRRISAQRHAGRQVRRCLERRAPVASADLNKGVYSDDLERSWTAKGQDEEVESPQTKELSVVQ